MKKRVLVAPLDWGLGHASRCVPIIRRLLDHSCDVVLAGSGSSLALLRQEFPLLPAFQLPGYAPAYPTTGSMVIAMARQLPHFIRTINQEHEMLERMVREQRIDLIVSDNRYGCWSTHVPSVFITHQSNILMPKRFGWFAPVVRRMNERMMKRFTVCWIPDYEGEKSIAGALIKFGSDAGINRRYIGTLSRFVPGHRREIKYDLLCVLSGPEPQRTVLENIVLSQLKHWTGRALLVRGLTQATDSLDTHVQVVNFMNSAQLQEAMESSAVVVARSGFSTVMDMSVIGGKVIFVPTPGQTEQEYLAKSLREKGIAFSVDQKDFNLARALQQVSNYTGFVPNVQNEDFLDKALEQILAN